MRYAIRFSMKVAAARTCGRLNSIGHAEGDVPSVQHATDVDQR